MPRLRRKRKILREPSEDQIDALLTGHQFHFGGVLTEDAQRELWEELGGELLVDWVATKPTTRPAAWWAFSAPGRRKRIGTMIPTVDGGHEFAADDKPHPFDDRVRREHLERSALKHCDSPADREKYISEAYTLSFGTPSVLCVKDDFAAVFETETQFLDRAGLLTVDEQIALTDTDLDDEP